MVIICQNINQSKRWKSGFKYADDLTTNENCYNKLLDEKPDIIILTEVTYPKNIEQALTGFSCYYNSDKYTPCYRKVENTKKYVKDEFLCNKIQIFYKKSVFDIINEPDESLYIENGFFDYLHLSLKRKSDKKIFDVIGLRIKGISFTKNPTKKEIEENRKENNKINIAISELLHKISGFENVIIGGDFNHGIIEKKEKDYIQYSYNFQTLYRIVSKMNYTLLTKGLQIINGDINSDDFECCFDETEWTHQLKNDKGGYLRRPIDHFIVSRNIKETEYQLIKDIDGVDKISDLFYYYDLNENKYKDGGFKSGLPDHRIIKLTIKE